MEPKPLTFAIYNPQVQDHLRGSGSFGVSGLSALAPQGCAFSPISPHPVQNCPALESAGKAIIGQEDLVQGGP